MAWCTIEPTDWSEFLASFTGRHEGWLVRLGGTLEQLGDALPDASEGSAVGDGWWPLRELRYEREREGGEIVVVLAAPAASDGARGGIDARATTAGREVELRVAEPRRVAVEQTSAGIERAVAVAGWGGRLTLRLRRAIAPELVDGPIGPVR